MEYDVNRTEFVKTQKTKHTMQTSEHIFQICIDCIVHNHIFLQVIFSLCSDIFVKCFICSVASHLLSSSVSVHCPHWCVYFQILYNTMDFCEWKLKLTRSWKWIICKRITEHTCWSVAVQSTRHIKFFMCNNSMPK